MSFDGIHHYTTTTAVGSVRMMEFCVFEAMSQLVSPQTMLDVDDSADNVYIWPNKSKCAANQQAITSLNKVTPGIARTIVPTTEETH